MRHPSFRQTFSMMPPLAFAAAAAIGCAGEIEDGDYENNPDDYQFAVLTQPQWTFCAKQGQRCAFTGTKQVRFGKDGRTTTRSFTDGVNCTNRAFGVRYSTGNQCEVLLDVAVDAGASVTPDAGAPAADAGHDHTMPAVCSNFVARVTITGGHDPRFLTYPHAALYSLRVNTRHIKQSTGIQKLDSASYLSQSTGLPPDLEQRAIAAFLDRETAKIEALIVKVREAIERLKELRTALISAAVTGKIDVREEAA